MSDALTILEITHDHPSFDVHLTEISQAYVEGLSAENNSSSATQWRAMLPNADKQIKSQFHVLLSSQSSAKNCSLFVAKESDKFAGYILVAIRECIGEIPAKIGSINGIFVLEPYRHLGVGQKLYNRAQKWLLDKNVTYLEITVNLGNAAAIEFWKKNGFFTTEQIMGKQI